MDTEKTGRAEKDVKIQEEGDEEGRMARERGGVKRDTDFHRLKIGTGNSTGEENNAEKRDAGDMDADGEEQGGVGGVKRGLELILPDLKMGAGNSGGVEEDVKMRDSGEKDVETQLDNSEGIEGVNATQVQPGAQPPDGAGEEEGVRKAGGGAGPDAEIISILVQAAGGGAGIPALGSEKDLGLDASKSTAANAVAGVPGGVGGKAEDAPGSVSCGAVPPPRSFAVCCSALWCVAVCCRVLQYGAVWCSVTLCVAVCCSMMQCDAV